MSNSAGAIGGGLIALYVILCVAVCVVMFVSMWKIFTKAGEAGWKCFIPIYNGMTLYKIIYGSYGKFFLTLIPGFGEVVMIFAAIRLGQVYGKSVGFCLGLVFLSPVFMIILAFSDAQYQGPVSSFI